jgi:hypothetical protein
MTFSKAQQEFAIRYYLWGQSEFKKEVEDSFPTLRVFKAGRYGLRYRFMQQLAIPERLVLASAFVKRSNPDAIKALGESITPEEESLLEQARAFNLKPQGLELEISARQASGEKIKFASKAKLRSAILKQFKEAFGHQCIGLALVGLDPELSFKMEYCGWLLKTDFDFRGRDQQVVYSHQIKSETVKEADGVRDGVLGFPSLTGWLGTRGEICWGYLMDEDIQGMCDFIVQRCRHFFGIAPKLLKGLEAEKIEPCHD